MNRRKFLGITAAGLGAMAAGCSAREPAGGDNRALGVQLYTLREQMARSVTETLRAVAQTGYRSVEFAGYFDQPPREIRTILDGEGLASPAGHFPLEMMRRNFQQILDDAQTVGHRYLVLPWLSPEQRQSLDQYKRLAQDLNRWGEACNARGMKMAYHNHDFEFEAKEGITPYQLLLEESETDKVFFEMDLYWMAKAGRDAQLYFQQNPGRFPLWHLKDMAADGAMADLGSGILDFRKIYASRDLAGFEYGFVERDDPEDAYRSIRAGYKTMAGIM